MTIFECYNQTKKQLKAAGIEDSAFEARQILRFITRYTNAQIMERYTQELTPVQESLWLVTLKQRCTHYPLQFILGEWDFYGLHFKVGEGCLAPRGDTETLVDEAFETCKAKEDACVLDLCSGSGCVGITVAVRYPKTAVTLVEKYEVPLHYTKQNIEELKAPNATAVCADVFDYEPTQRFDLIVSNPPYVSRIGMDLLNEEARHEPQTALFGGEDGLDFYREILCRYPAYLVPGGRIAVEVGFDQSSVVQNLFKKAGAHDVGVRKDLNGIDRVVFGTFGML